MFPSLPTIMIGEKSSWPVFKVSEARSKGILRVTQAAQRSGTKRSPPLGCWQWDLRGCVPHGPVRRGGRGRLLFRERPKPSRGPWFGRSLDRYTGAGDELCFLTRFHSVGKHPRQVSEPQWTRVRVPAKAPGPPVLNSGRRRAGNQTGVGPPSFRTRTTALVRLPENFETTPHFPAGADFENRWKEPR